MPSNPWPLIRRLIRPPSGDAVPDAELLRRFAEGRDQAAFELLVWRHGGMVLGVCRRVLRDGHAAEDAFQAAFLVLARKAGSVRAGASVAGWLHRVARRVALRAAKQRATRRQRETVLVADPPARAGAEPDAELRAVLDAEIDRLPERFRLPVVLCYLDGRTTEDAARLLGVPRGTVLSRLATARQRLAARLTRRGVTLPAGGLFGVGWAARETVSAEQVGECVSAATAFVAGGAGAGVAFQLANGVIQMGTRKVIAAWATALVVAAGLTTGVGVTTGGPKLAAEAPPAAPKPAATPPAPPTQPIDRLRALKMQLDKKIAETNQLLARLQDDVPNPIVLKALSDVYTQAEIAAFQTQLDVVGLERKIADHKKRIHTAETTPISWENEAVVTWCPPSIRQLDNDIRATQEQLQKVAPKQSDTTPAVKRLREELKRLEAARLKEFKAHEPRFKQILIEEKTRADREALAAATAELEPKQIRLNDLNTRRKELRQTLEKMTRQSSEIEPLKAELQTYREQSQRLGREILNLEIQRATGGAPPAASADADKLDRILRELADLRADVRRLQEQKK
jgi:RNA polymerase sigma factor (sigma-70 family)